MNDASPDKQDKFRRYRARKKAAGLREIRMWVPDINAPGFKEKLDKEIAAINASKDSAEVQAWLDEMTEEVWNDLP